MMHVLSFILAAFAASAVSAAPLPNYDPTIPGALGGGKFSDTAVIPFAPALGQPSVSTVPIGNPAYGGAMGGNLSPVPTAPPASGGGAMGGDLHPNQF